MKHFVVIANAYKDRDFALTNKIVAYIEQKGGTAKGLMSNVEAISDNEFELEDIPQDTQCILVLGGDGTCLLYTSPSPRDLSTSRMPSSA